MPNQVVLDALVAFHVGTNDPLWVADSKPRVRRAWKMLIAALILVLSVVALAQFGLYYWRSVMAQFAAQPISDHLRTAAELAGVPIESASFDLLLILHEQIPGFQESELRLNAVRLYYRWLATITSLTSKRFPVVAAWSTREMLTCSRCLTVQLDRRIAKSIMCGAEAQA